MSGGKAGLSLELIHLRDSSFKMDQSIFNLRGVCNYCPCGLFSQMTIFGH